MAGPNGQTHVVICDLREELLVYIGGAPYLRRDAEAPSASLKHAGIAAEHLHRMEESLRDDARVEARKWGGRIFLHKEVDSKSPFGEVPMERLHVD